MASSNMPSTPDSKLIKNPLGWSIGLVLISALLLLGFRAMPGFEIWFSELFFTQKSCPEGGGTKVRCGRFYALANEPLLLLRSIGLRLPQIFAGAIALWLIWIALMKPNKLPFDLLKPTHALLSMALGPALFTNAIFKPLWGRPRPIQTIEFGGDAPYVLPGDVTNHCVGNCSFVSGEATAAFWMLWIIPFLPPRWRWPLGGIIFLVACGISLLRVVFGAHFLSDVVLAGMMAGFAIVLSAYILQTSWVQGWVNRWCNYSNKNSFISQK